MAAIGNFLKNAWNSHPAVTAACGIGVLDLLVAMVIPFNKYPEMINKATPYNYPVPVRDDGNMPDVPAHPCDPQGPNLDWLKNL